MTPFHLSFNSDNTLLVGAAHSDFDGDGCPDVLVLTKNESHQLGISAFIYWNVGQRLSSQFRKADFNFLTYPFFPPNLKRFL